jgi:hypothetical protein
MASQKVKRHTHATPQVYLRRFAVGGGLMTERAPEPLGTPVVGVRTGFYTLDTPEGGSNQFEDALGALENRVNPVFAKIDAAQLPLDTTDKVVMAEFVGTQMCRGVTYRDLHRVLFVERELFLRERVRAIFQRHAPERIAEAEAYDLSRMTTQNEAIRASVETGQVMANVLMNMRWQVVRWSKPVLLSSDQPAVCWHAPHQSSPWGASDAVEIRMPLSPTQALVASWHDAPDGAEIIVGDKLAAMSMNHHTRRHRVDWLFWQPDTEPVQGHPLHDEPLSGPPPAQSRRWHRVHEHVEKLIEARPDNRIAVLTIP